MRLKICILLIALLVGSLHAPQVASAQQQDESQPFYVPINLSFDEIDLERLTERLARFGIEIPIELSGRATTTIRGRLPLGQLANARAYELSGTLTSVQMAVSGVELTEVTAAVVYDDGVLRLDELQATIPPQNPGGPAGSFRGQAKLQLAPRGALDLKLTLDNVPASQFVELVPELAEVGRGSVSGNVAGQVAVDRLGEIEAWQATGNVSVDQLRLYALPPAQATTTFRVADGLLTVSELTGRVKDTSLSGTAEFRLSAPYRFQSQLGLDVNDLAIVQQLDEQVQLPVEVRGAAELTTQLQGTLVPLRWLAEGVGRAEPLEVEQVAVDALRFGYRTAGEQLQLNNIRAQLYGGSVAGSVTVPLTAAADAQLQARWQDLQADALLQDIAGNLVPVSLGARGSIAGTLDATIPPEGLSDVSGWQAELELSIRSPKLLAWTATSAELRAYVEEGSAVVTELTAVRGRSRLQARGSMTLSEPYGYQAILDIDNAELSRLNALPAPYRPPVRVAGLYGLAAELEGDLLSRTLTAEGSAVLLEGQIADAQIQRAQFQAAFDGAVLRLSELQATVYGGHLRGLADIPLAPEAAGRVELTWADVGIGRLAGELIELPVELSGASSGQASLAIPPGELTQLLGWQGQASVTVDQLGIGELEALEADAQLRLAERTLTIERLQGQLMAGDLELSGQLQLVAPHRYELSGTLTEAQLARLNDLPDQLGLPESLAGTASWKADLAGTLQPLQSRGSGTLSADHVMVREFEFDALRLAFAIDEQQLSVQELVVQLYEGQLEGSATIPLAPQRAGRATAQWADINLGLLLEDAGEGQWPARISAPSSGRLALDMPAGLATAESWELDLSLQVPVVEANEVRVGQLEADVRYREAVASVRASGQLLDGSFQLDGQHAGPLFYEAAEEAPDVVQRPPADTHVSAQVQGLQLARLGDVFRDSPRLQQLAGTIDLSLTYPTAHSAPDDPSAGGRLMISNLQFAGVSLADRLQGQLLADQGRIYLNDFAGTYAGGRLRATASIDLAELQRSQFELSLAGARVSEALIAWPDVAEVFDGVADLQLRGNLGYPLRAMGVASLREGQVTGISMTGIRLPLQLSVNPATGEVLVEMRDSAAQLARGRVSGRMTLGYSRGLYLDGRWEFSNVDLQTFLREVTADRQYGTGRLSGTLTLSGRNIRSVNDLSGRLDGRLRNTQALRLPLLQQLQPYVARGATGSTRFGDGALEAYLARGIIRVEELTLVSDVMQLFISGQVTLAGRLNLEVVASNQQLGQNQFVAQALLAQLPQLGAPPVAALTAANDFLSNRVIHLQVTGTVRSPSVRVRPLPLLEQEAVRFFLRQAVGS